MGLKGVFSQCKTLDKTVVRVTEKEEQKML